MMPVALDDIWFVVNFVYVCLPIERRFIDVYDSRQICVPLSHYQMRKQHYCFFTKQIVNRVDS